MPIEFSVKRELLHMPRSNSWRTVWSQIVSVVVMVSFSGCSFLASSQQTIYVSSSPPGAMVTAGGKSVGQTPVQFEAYRGKDLLIEVQKPGYQAGYRTTTRTLSSVGVLDTVAGWIFIFPLLGLPWLGLTSSGAWKHDPDQYMFALDLEKAPEK